MHGKYIFDSLDCPINWLLGKITLSLGGNGYRPQKLCINKLGSKPIPCTLCTTCTSQLTSQKCISFKLLILILLIAQKRFKL